MKFINCLPSVFGCRGFFFFSIAAAQFLLFNLHALAIKPYGANLIVNGNAEEGVFSSTGAALPGALPVPGWTISSAFTVVDYKPLNDTSGFPKSSDAGPPDRLKKFFAGGNAATSTATQQIDLTAYATDINQVKVTFDLSGYLGGFSSEADNATLRVDFFKGVMPLGGYAIGPVTPANRINETSLLFRSVTAAVPPTATVAVVTLTMTRVSNTFNDGYADSLSLVLRAPMVVTTTADSGDGSLRSALTAGNTITFDPGVFAAAGAPPVISLLTELPPLNSNINIVGLGANVLTVQRSRASGTPEFRIFAIDLLPGGLSSSGTFSTVTISGLTIRNGLLSSSGGFNLGAGIVNFGNLTLNDSVVTGNQTDSAGGGIFNGGTGTMTLNRSVVSNNLAGDAAGGILNEGILSLNNSTVSGNQATNSGGGVWNLQSAVLDKCTISGNSAGTVGGGLRNDSEGSVATTNMTLTNCTLSGNTAVNNGGGVYDSGPTTTNLTLHNCTLTGNSASAGGGIYLDTRGGVFAFDNSIFKLGSAGQNIVASNSSSSSGGHNLSNDAAGDGTGTAPGGFLNGSGDIRNTDPLLGPLQDNGGPTLTHALLPGSPAIDNGNSNLTTDQRGAPRPFDDPNSHNGGGNNSDIGAFEFQGTPPVVLANISGRLPVGTGDNALFAGFIVSGYQPKRVIIRAIGPSLGVAGRLADPTLELRDSNGVLLQANDNWKDSPDKQAIIDSTVAPTNDLESAIVAALPASIPGTGYTAIVRGANSATGIGVVEVYDLDRTLDSKLANISNRGFVQTGDNALFAGNIVVGQASQKVIIRAIGPSLLIRGGTVMADPTLELHDANGGLLESNDNWVDSPNKQAIIDSTIPPSNNLESAIVRTLSPANYTAIVRGANNTTGIAVVEVYALK